MKVCKRHIVKTSLAFITCFILNIILVPPHSALAETWSEIPLGEYASCNFAAIGGIAPDKVFLSYITGGGGVLRYNGSSFTEMTVPTNDNIVDIAGNLAISYNRIFKYDGDNGWNVDFSAEENLYNISLSSEGDLAAVVGARGYRLTREDGGWETSQDSFLIYSDIYVSDDSHFYELMEWQAGSAWRVILRFRYYDSGDDTWKFKDFREYQFIPAGITVVHVWGKPDGNNAGKIFTAGQNTIGHFDGESWSKMDHPFSDKPNLNLGGIVDHDGALYAYGQFFGNGVILKLCGSKWVSVTPQGAVAINDMASIGGSLFAVGNRQVWKLGPSPAPGNSHLIKNVSQVDVGIGAIEWLAPDESQVADACTSLILSEDARVAIGKDCFSAWVELLLVGGFDGKHPLLSEYQTAVIAFIEIASDPTICDQAPGQRALKATENNQVTLKLESGAGRFQSLRSDLEVNIETRTATVNSVSQNDFAVGFNPAAYATIAACYEGSVTVYPDNTALSVVTLEPGQQVEVTGDSIGPVTPIPTASPASFLVPVISLLLLEPTPPIVTTQAATAISQTGAVLNGTVNPNGDSTTAYFQWGETTSYGQTTANQDMGSGATAVSLLHTLSNLTCNTTYHYRAVGTNNGGTTYGEDQILTTGGCEQDPDVIFFDDFSGAAPYDGSQWNNERGDWSVSNGVYDAGSPSNNPLTYTSAKTGDLTDFVLDVDINRLYDGGLWLRSSLDGGTISGVLLVTGGYTSGYDGLYWHTCSNGSCSEALNVVSGLGLNNSDVHLKVVVQGNEHRVYVNGSNTPATTLTDTQFSSGQVGLYDESNSQTFDNVRISQVAAPQTYPFPDTGQTKCYDNSVEITCPQPGEDFCGQDGQHQGPVRSYTKLGMNGVELPDTATQADGWLMTRDNTTGLIWEIKTDDGGIHDKDNTYTLCDTNPATNGGNQGTCGDGTDTEDFITALNNANFGGYGDWRLPMVKELSSLINRSIPFAGPVVDTDFFPDTGLSSYWSSNTRVDFSEDAWRVDFDDGEVWSYPKSDSYYACAVRSGQPQAANRFADNLDGTVTDIETGLMWQQATAPGTYTWKQALAYVQTLNSQSFAGHNDWRLPDVNELQSLVDYSQHHPPIDTDFFPDCTTSGYVTSTTDASNTDSAWRVYFGLGSVYAAHELDKNNKLDSDYVRAVRGGKTSNDSFGTILTFDINGMENGDVLSPAYGDRVTSASMGPYDSYGGGGGFTPNVEVTYANETGGDLTFWTTGYNDLINVVRNAVEFQNGYSITFNADPGFIVSLMSLDIGNSGAAITVPGITITDGEETELSSKSNITLDPGSTQTHKTFNFGPAVSAGELVLHVDTTGLNSDSDNIALDNIHFSQMASSVPDVIFFDDFSSSAPYDGSQWNNERGDWSVSNGVYDAGSPSNNPLTYTSAKTGDLTDFVLDVDINSFSSGGLWLRSSWDENAGKISGVLLVIGGYWSGYDGLYWHTCLNDICSNYLNVASGLGLNSSDVHLKVVVQGDKYRVYVNGSNTPATTLTDAQFSSGRVGLYDESTSQTFDNVRITQ